MRRNTIVMAGIAATLFLCLCCLLAGLFFEGSILPNKPCRPLTYPDGSRTTESRDYTVADPMENVLEYYDRQLSVGEVGSSDTGQWSREDVSSSVVLYTCYGVDINRITTETGCIIVSQEASDTRIRTQLWRSEGAHTPCER